MMCLLLGHVAQNRALSPTTLNLKKKKTKTRIGKPLTLKRLCYRANQAESMILFIEVLVNDSKERMFQSQISLSKPPMKVTCGSRQRTSLKTFLCETDSPGALDTHPRPVPDSGRLSAASWSAPCLLPCGGNWDVKQTSSWLSSLKNQSRPERTSTRGPL